ncbi:TM2 domain-containing protein [Nonlabens ponticola]|uniref:TM2 domain-containing protein n=1 Tax=Nonlabens ponticola TaxID=2496866 RepID=A0A3S9MX05_9FLAO|nr:TM2 domain-containing protein [Nonlabens ponticola]AZQ43786.1 TM2 domain-containing protein [Nonlabens ponticola]
MKSNFTLAVVSIFMLISSISYASFPVERNVVTTINVETAVEETTTVLSSPAAVVWEESQTIATVLWFFLGFVAGHRWYLGSPVGWNILYILTFGGLGIWAIIDLIDILTGNYPGL